MVYSFAISVCMSQPFYSLVYVASVKKFGVILKTKNRNEKNRKFFSSFPMQRKRNDNKKITLRWEGQRFKGIPLITF